MTRTATYLLAAAAVLAALLYARRRVGVVGSTVAGSLGYDVGSAAVDMVDGVVAGAVVGTGELFGVTRTDLTECERAKAEGRTWDASFACPAGSFLKYAFDWGL